MRVFIASPYAGDVEANEAYAREAMLDSIRRGEAPFVPHLLYTQVLPEDGGEGRRLGLALAQEMMAGCELVALYVDRGISNGMLGEEGRARQIGLRIERRRIRCS